MGDPRRSRNVALMFFAVGVALAALYATLPKEAVQNRLLGIVLILFAPPALLFGVGSAIANHIRAMAQDKLVRGGDVIARWRVDAELWREFIALNRQLAERPGAPFNELEIPDASQDDGVQVLIGPTSVKVGESFHELSPRGTPQITHAKLDAGSRPSFIELGLYYPPYPDRAEVRNVLRFPVANGERIGARIVVEHFVGSRPARPVKADFFHGRGDGSDAEDLSNCLSCGYQTHRYVSICPECNGSMLSKRWVRRMGAVMGLIGLVVCCVAGALIFHWAPLLLQPGIGSDGARFSGSVVQGLLYIGVVVNVFVLGLVLLMGGLFQFRTARRDVRIVRFALGLVTSLALLALLIVVLPR